MTEIEVLSCDLNYRCPFPEVIVAPEKYTEKEYNNRFLLRSRKERSSLLKEGFTGKEIESEYLRLNGIVIININWQDLNSK